jgi:hypothetical protein
MNVHRTSTRALALAAALSIPALTNGCGAEDELCCNEFKAGAQISAEIGGSAQAQVAVQAVADFAGIASAAITDLSSACRSMAEELDAPRAKLDEAEAAGAGGSADERARAQMNAYCALALDQIAAVKAVAQGSIRIVAQPPKCQASVSAKANCQAKCDVSGKCDIKANPPTCSGGSLTVACKGSCELGAKASIACEGKCEANCEGSCTAQGGVECQGKCEGTCKGAAQGGTGEGITATGECKGTCEGTCSVTAPGVKCEGSCNGQCTGTCSGSAEVTAKCDGECKADFEPLKCEGGTLEGGCKVDAKCDANCDASVSAKAECTPPAIVVTIEGAADIEAAAKLKAVFEANMGIVFAFKSRLEAMGKVTGTIIGNADAIADIKAVCIIQVAAVGKRAVDDVTASIKVTGDLVASTQ